MENYKFDKSNENEDIFISGKIELESDIQYGKVNVSGKLKYNKNLLLTDLKCDGKVDGIGNIVSDNNILINGKLKADTIVCKNFILNGKAVINCLQGKNIEIMLSGISQIQEIQGCDSILITKKELSIIEKGIVDSIFNIFQNKDIEKTYMHINKLIANEIKLSYCKVSEVQGNNIIIGPDCEIEQVTYSDNFECHSTSKIKKVIKR